MIVKNIKDFDQTVYMYQVVKKNVTQEARSKSARNKDNDLKIDDSIVE